jgi:hypothetical protein
MSWDGPDEYIAGCGGDSRPDDTSADCWVPADSGISPDIPCPEDDLTVAERMR